jgi:hypothetical protein
VKGEPTVLLIDTDNPGPIFLRCEGQEDSTNTDGSIIKEYWINPRAIAGVESRPYLERFRTTIILTCGVALTLQYLSVSAVVELLKLEKIER